MREEAGEVLAQTHSLSPSFSLFSCSLFSPSPLLTAQCNQLSSLASYLKLGHTFSSSSPPHILWNLHLTDLEVLDRTST